MVTGVPVDRIALPGAGDFPFLAHHPAWFRDLLNVYVGAGALKILEARTDERRHHVDVPASLALPCGHPAWIYAWPTQARIVRVYGRLAPEVVAELMDEISAPDPISAHAFDEHGKLYRYPWVLGG